MLSIQCKVESSLLSSRASVVAIHLAFAVVRKENLKTPSGGHNLAINKQSCIGIKPMCCLEVCMSFVDMCIPLSLYTLSIVGNDFILISEMDLRGISQL